MRKTTGISLILLIFLSLCLLTFSLLSLSGALADERLSQKAADRTTEYYAAVSAAHKNLAEIDAFLQRFFAENSGKEMLTADDLVSLLLNADELAELGLQADSDPATDSSIDPYSLAFDVAVNETQQLHVVLVLYQPATDSDAAPGRNTSADSDAASAALDSLYEVVEWKTINTKKWNADQSQKLFRIPEA